MTTLVVSVKKLETMLQKLKILADNNKNLKIRDENIMGRQTVQQMKTVILRIV